jgi:hypothetical protein
MPGLLAFTRMTGDLVKAMRACPQPIVAAVDGVCAGAGAILAMASDLRLGTARSKTAFLFNRVGLAGCDMGACAMLPRVIGQGRAASCCTPGARCPARRAERWGFFNRLCEPEACWRGARLRRAPGRRPDLRPRHDQDHAAAGMEHGHRRGHRGRSAGAGDLHGDQDFQRAYHAFVAKQKPNSKGLTWRQDYLDWPFFEPRHARWPGARRLGRAARPQQHGPTSTPPAARWCASWAQGGWLRHAVAARTAASARPSTPAPSA